MSNPRIVDMAHWLIATRKAGREIDETERRLLVAFPDTDVGEIDDALRLAGELLGGERSTKWGTC